MQDGVDHINVYSNGVTELGRWLSNFAHTPFDLPDDGPFGSVEGYWYWLGTRDDRLRVLHGFAAKKLGRQLRSDHDVESVPDFADKIRRAIDAKLKSDRRKLRCFAESMLPLRHYYVFGGVRKEAGYGWIIEHLEARRRLLKAAWKLA